MPDMDVDRCPYCGAILRHPPACCDRAILDLMRLFDENQPEGRPVEKGNCRACKKPVLWYTTTLGAVMPLDPEPCDDGNVVIVDGKALSLKGDLWEEHHDGPRYKSHFATCPNAAEFRKKKGAK